ncbi:hypothetical protein EDF67_107133 [Sphingobacterium sp. JUb78]|nr:hypothetical protein [Sphingobacterium kitahiroshimense]TCR08344.1 hypothetical protein EDF67_107133 [Sphingobacterium sp. JUb78]
MYVALSLNNNNTQKNKPFTIRLILKLYRSSRIMLLHLNQEERSKAKQ